MPPCGDPWAVFVVIGATNTGESQLAMFGIVWKCVPDIILWFYLPWACNPREGSCVALAIVSDKLLLCAGNDLMI